MEDVCSDKISLILSGSFEAMLELVHTSSPSDSRRLALFSISGVMQVGPGKLSVVSYWQF